MILDKIIFTIFILRGMIARYFFAWIKNRIFKKIIDKVVATAAPVIPEELTIPKIEGNGIKITFKITLTIVAMIMSARINLDFPAMERILLEIIPIEDANEPSMSILNASCARIY